MPDALPPPAPTADAGGRAGRWVTAAGIAGLLALTLAHPSATRLQTWPWAAGVAVLHLLPVLALALAWSGSGAFRWPGRWLLAGLVGLALAAVASAALGPFPLAALTRCWPTLSGVALCLWLHHWLTDPASTSGRRENQLGTVIALGGALVLVVSLVTWLRIATPSLATFRNAVPFGHANYTAGCAILLLPWLAAAAFNARGPLRAGWALAMVTALVVLAGTSSRGGVAALGALLALAAALALARSRWSRPRKLLLVAALAFVALAAALANPRLRDLVLHRRWSDDAHESNRQRSAMLQAGWQLGRERPLLGWGPGSVPLAYPRVRATLDGGVENVLQLHNTPLQLWATLGAAGLAAAALLVTGLGHAARRALRDDTLRPAVGASLSSLAGGAVFCLTDHPLDLPAFTALVAAGAALLGAATADTPAAATTPGPRRRLPALLGAALLTAAPLLALTRDLRARRAYDDALDALQRNQLAAALAHLDRASACTPADPYFQHQAAAALLAARDTTTDPGRRLALTREAVQRLEASLAAGVFQEYAHFNLGWLQLELGAPASAARHFAAAARLVPDKGGVYFGLGLALLAADRRDDAVRAFALEWINDPRSATSPAWEVPALAALRGSIRRETAKHYDQLRSTYPPAAAAAAWAAWWHGEAAPDAALPPGFTAESAAFAAALPAIRAGAPVATTAPWATLYAEWRAGRFTKATAPDAAVGQALVRRTARHGADFGAFLRAGTGDDAALVRGYRRTRTGAGVLALHPEGPPLADLYIVQENRVVADHAAGLFPPKGWLPGRFLLALLPPDPR